MKITMVRASAPIEFGSGSGPCGRLILGMLGTVAILALFGGRLARWFATLWRLAGTLLSRVWPPQPENIEPASQLTLGSGLAKDFGMGRSRKICRSGSRPVRGVGAVLLILFLVLLGLAAIPSLHQAIHDDANAPGHHCAVSALANGQVEMPDCVASICLPLTFFGCVLPNSDPLIPGFEELLPPGRAPPAILF